MPIRRSKGDRLLSTTWEEDFLNQAVTVSQTWYTVTSYSGMGILCGAAATFTTTPETGEARITIDGTAHDLTKNTAYLVTGYGGASSPSIGQGLQFQTSLLFAIRKDGDTNAALGWCEYGFLSEEFKREIIPAGEPIPDRDGNPRPDTYPFDVMLVWFIGPYGISNKVEFPRGPTLEITYLPDGTPAGVVKKGQFNLEVKGPRRIMVPDTSDSEHIIKLHDEKEYIVSCKNGILDASLLPKKTMPIDARKGK